MPSVYLQTNEYTQYNLPANTTVAQVQQASALLDAFLRRPEGLVYVPDWTGILPCYMAANTPQYAFTSTGSISPGTNVNVPVTVAIPAFNDSVGDVVILDRSNTGLLEACIISAVSPGTLQLAKVVNSHSANCTMETGLVITEARSLAYKRSIMHVSRPPLRLLSGLGRYAYGRRTDQQAGLYAEVNLLAALATFGGPPQWVPFDVTQAGSDVNTHEVWVPAGLLLAYFSEVRLRYVSGFPQSQIPACIKQATAMAVLALTNEDNLASNIKSFRAGDTQIVKFENTIIDPDTRRMLSEHRVKLMI